MIETFNKNKISRHLYKTTANNYRFSNPPSHVYETMGDPERHIKAVCQYETNRTNCSSQI